MKIINRRIHGLLDYVVAVLLMASPWIFNFNDNADATYVMVGAGILTLFYSLLTNYEFGLFKWISFDTHLSIDIAAAIFLGLSPWLLGFYERIYLPHLIFGIIELLVISLTVRDKQIQTKPTMSASCKK